MVSVVLSRLADKYRTARTALWDWLCLPLAQRERIEISRRQSEKTGLFLAAHFGLVRHLATLVACGQSPSEQDANGETLLLWAVANLHEDDVRWLLEHGADPNTQDCGLRTALHLAALQGQSWLIRLLLSRVAHPALVGN
ncbi:ankyrin repeat-containing domain protein [Achaetomium macrosporum]|uniref:Ankyrin repeat-containing domain protein n=1 Tax=Achaetomium macrosporum TaxID=79813 RepID=A0AAN7C526_9PEZI|nr:ankyrin repeat-containing domain protein [Achaetomium macrosporum]